MPPRCARAAKGLNPSRIRGADSRQFTADRRRTRRLQFISLASCAAPEPVAVSVITLSELWFGIELEEDAARARRRRRWTEKLFQRLEVVPMDARIARTHARIWAQLAALGQMIGPHDLIVAATALQRRWAVATFNAREFRHVRDLEVIEP